MQTISNTKTYPYKGKRIDWFNHPKDEWWVHGYFIDNDIVGSDRCFIGTLVIVDSKSTSDDKYERVRHLLYEVDPDTVCRYTGLSDKDNNPIYENDITELDCLPSIHRRFAVKIGNIKRTVVNLPDFVEGTSDVVITGVYYEWYSYKLLPCLDTSGVPDNKHMKIVGNCFDDTALLL